jgi:hypothetical protein
MGMFGRTELMMRVPGVGALAGLWLRAAAWLMGAALAGCILVPGFAVAQPLAFVLDAREQPVVDDLTVFPVGRSGGDTRASRAHSGGGDGAGF